MFFDEGDASLSLIGSVVALAVPLAAAVNFTVLQHVGLNKEVVASKDKPAQDMLLAQLEVIFGVTWAWLWAGEQLSVNTLTGGALVLGALMINALTGIFREQRSQELIA